MLRVRSCFLLHVIVVAVCLGTASGEDPAQDNAAARKQLLKLIPTPLPVTLPAKDGPTFYGANLYQYNDGGAEIYHLYEFRLLLHQEFRAGGSDLIADIFDMGSTENAFGMYSSERSPSYHYLAIGTEGYRGSGMLNFYQGRYYVKLTTYGAGAEQVFEKFARGIAARIGPAVGAPALLQQFPLAHRKPHAEQFVRQSPMGHDFLAPAYLAHYAFDKADSTLLISVASDAADARRRLGLLDTHFRSTGKSDSFPALGPGAIRAKNSYEGEVIAQAQGRYLVLLLNPVGGATEFLRSALGRFK